MSIYNRSNFLKTVSVDGYNEKDLLSSPVNTYTFKRPFSRYILEYDDYMRPDLISLKNYGIQDYWWIILKVNPELEDIWNDFVITDDQENTYPDAFRVGDIINIPNLLDLQEMYTYTKNEIENV